MAYLSKTQYSKWDFVGVAILARKWLAKLTKKTEVSVASSVASSVLMGRWKVTDGR